MTIKNLHSRIINNTNVFMNYNDCTAAKLSIGKKITFFKFCFVANILLSISSQQNLLKLSRKEFFFKSVLRLKYFENKLFISCFLQIVRYWVHDSDL